MEYDEEVIDNISKLLFEDIGIYGVAKIGPEAVTLDGCYTAKNLKLIADLMGRMKAMEPKERG